MLTGSCLCRAIRYEVTVPIAELRHCHCADCQKSSGAGGSVNAMIPSSGFRLTHGTPKSKQFPGQPDPPATRA